MILRKRQRKSKIKNLCVQACYADCACHRMRRKSWFLELVLLVVFSALLSTADGSLSTVLDLKLQPEMPNNVYYSLRGSPFVLNCTARVGNYAQASNLTWQHDKKWLFSEVRHIDNSTVQLTLSSTSSDNDGIYWCGPRLGNMSQGVNMSLIVADPPSPPRNIRYSVVGAMDLKREYRIFWSASSLTGGLPVNYMVKLCVNDSFAVKNNACIWSSNPDCRPTNVLSTDKNFVCVLHYSRDFVSPCENSCNYTISVVAENAVGTVSSWRYLPYIPLYSATPWPPSSFNVVTTDKPNELRVSWMPRKAWRYTEMEYTILYHARNEMENKTKIISAKNTFLTGVPLFAEKLKAFMEYYVYLTVRFVNEEGMKSAPSEVLGPRIVKTPAGKPDTPSKVIGDWSVIFPGNPALRNVIVEWKFKRNYSWHGLPGKHVIYCTHRYKSQEPPPDCEYHVNATSNRAVLQGLDSAKSYKVFIKRCNKEHVCAHGEPYIIKEYTDNSPQRKNKGKLSRTQIIWISVSVAVASLTVVVVACYWGRNWLHERAAPLVIRLRDRLILQPPAPPYNYVEPSAADDYDHLCLNEDQP